MDKIKGGAAICIIARQNEGKTYVAKQEAENSGFKNLVVYDPNREYDPNKYIVFYSLDAFYKFIVSDKSKNCFIICEEATTFLDGFKSKEITDIIVRIMHKLSVICFVFHSWMDASPYVLRKCRFVISMPTNDEPKDVERSRTKYYPYYLESRRIYNPEIKGSGNIYIDLNEL